MTETEVPQSSTTEMTETEVPQSGMTYTPPKELQDKKIWSLVIDEQFTKFKGSSRQQKVSEYNYSKKSSFALNSWPDLLKRFHSKNKKVAGYYTTVFGCVTDELVIIDVDHHKELPLKLKTLIQKYPTHYHRSKSGNGWKIYYYINEPLPKKCIKFEYGELFCNMFVTTTDPDLTDFSEETIASITREQLRPFIPEADKKPKEREITERQQAPDAQHIDLDRVIAEVQRMLSVIPVDIDTLLSVAYEMKFKDVEVNSYNHWLLVSHALSDLSIQLASEYPTASIRLQGLFHEWSQKGSSYKGEADCNERFERSLEETQEATTPIVSFASLRKLFWAYRIPVADFPVIVTKGSGKDKIKCVDPTDPENYEFLTNFLNLKLCREISHGNLYIKGPETVIGNYFSDNQLHYLTDNTPDISIPFPSRLKTDDNLTFRLIKVFRRFGIKQAGRSHPIFAGLNADGTEPLDTLYEWMRAVPWDKKPRVEKMIKASIKLDETMIPSEGSKKFLYSLIKKHLVHMAGLRAVSYRVYTDTQKATDRYKKAQGILLLAGYQKTRKSTWIECLLPSQAGYVKNVTPSSVKDSLEVQRALSGTFILNIDEIDAVLDNINLSDFKNVITQARDSYRTMYTQLFEDHPRAAGLFGTTNKQFLRLDRTGNRRFWIIPIKQCDATPFIKSDYQQVWAELLYYAESLSVEDWNLTDEEEDKINTMARQYTKQTAASKTLDMAFVDEDGESLLFDHTEFDFDLLFKRFPQKFQRLFVKEKLFFTTRGNKAFVHLQNKFIMDDNIELSLSSFNYEIGDLSDKLTGFHNITKAYDKLIYKAGIITYRTGKPTPTYYHFLPYKDTLRGLIAMGDLPKELLINQEESK